jgi:epoxide hydrolase-like predicted phosphatase
MTHFKNLIFDIGDVIVDIDYLVTIAEFQKLALIDFSEIVSYSRQHHIFDAFEKGQITAQEFRDQLRPFLKSDVKDEEINNAWNAILIHYPPAKIELLKSLKTRYRTFALSNINEIHIRSLNKAAGQLFGVNAFADFFHRAYYSSEMGCRKPEAKIYEMVLKDEQLNPAETFFVDDKEENIQAANALGIRAFQLKDRDKLHDLLHELGIV